MPTSNVNNKVAIDRTEDLLFTVTPTNIRMTPINVAAIIAFMYTFILLSSSALYHVERVDGTKNDSHTGNDHKGDMVVGIALEDPIE